VLHHAALDVGDVPTVEAGEEVVGVAERLADDREHSVVLGEAGAGGLLLELDGALVVLVDDRHRLAPPDAAAGVDVVDDRSGVAGELGPDALELSEVALDLDPDLHLAAEASRLAGSCRVRHVRRRRSLAGSRRMLT
jgi:hypothetical protein